MDFMVEKTGEGDRETTSEVVECDCENYIHFQCLHNNMLRNQ